MRVGAYQESSDKVTQSRMADIFRIFPRLAERRTQLAGTMSGGEQAMVSIGRGLMCAPKLLLIDEPSLGLSPRLVKENFKIIRQINERGITVLLVEQNVHQTLAISHFGFVHRPAQRLFIHSLTRITHAEAIVETRLQSGAVPCEKPGCRSVACDVCLWHLAVFRCGANFGRYWVHSGH